MLEVLIADILLKLIVIPVIVVTLLRNSVHHRVVNKTVQNSLLCAYTHKFITAACDGAVKITQYNRRIYPSASV